MPFEQVNEKVVSAPVTQGREVFARRRAMLAYTGQIGFAPVRATSGGLGGMAGRMMAGEQVAMMVAKGEGTVHYGYRGMHLTIIDVGAAGPLTVEADRLVGHDATLQATLVFLGSQGGIRARYAARSAGTGCSPRSSTGTASRSCCPTAARSRCPSIPAGPPPSTRRRSWRTSDRSTPTSR